MARRLTGMRDHLVRPGRASLKLPSGGPFADEYFYLPPVYNGSEIFTQSFCDSAQPPDGNNTNPFAGTYTATATYPTPTTVRR